VTIGGEPEGRPPILVDEKVPEMPIAKEQTTVAFGKAEPGVDIFAGEPAKDIKSEYVAPSQPAEDKEISSFNQLSSETLMNAERKKDEPILSIQTHPATKANDEEQARKPPLGPLDEPAAEANRAAKELYPEAHDKK